MRERRTRAGAVGAGLGLALALGLVTSRAAANPSPVEYEAPPSAGPPVCSVTLPLCVRGMTGTRGATLLAALGALERAWRVERGALALPSPDGGIDGPWTAYLVDGVPEGGTAHLAGRDPRGDLDRGWTFGVLDRTLAPGCALDAAAARAVARGSLWRAVPATDTGSAAAEASAVAALASGCAADASTRGAFQASPERALLDTSDASASSGAALFFDWVDATFGREPAALLGATWALAPTHTLAAAASWAPHPSAFDVWKVSLAGALGTDSDLDDVFLHFGIDRAFDWPPARLAWHLPWPDHARRVASPVAVAPTGASYVIVDHVGAPAGANLRLEADWEDYGRMRWAVVKVDAAGRPAAVLPIATQKMATHAAITVETLDGVDHLLVVGVDVGSTEHAFDPNQGAWEPHGWLLTVQPE